MKRFSFIRIATSSLAMLMIMAVAVTPQASTPPYHTETITELNGHIYLEGEKNEEDFNVIFKEEFTLVPLRKIFEAIGFEVNWDRDTQRTSYGDTGVHELLSDEYEYVFRTRKLSDSPYVNRREEDVYTSTLAVVDTLYFQEKRFSDEMNMFEGHVVFEEYYLEEDHLWECWTGRRPLPGELEKFFPSPTIACIINDRYYMEATHMRILLECIGYTMEVDTDNYTVSIAKLQ